MDDKWRFHPTVRSDNQLSRGERAADLMRNRMGSWAFVIWFTILLIAWAITNTLIFHNQSWDPYPYILLNLFLSMLAAIQGAILLIAAKRQDQIASELAKHDYSTNQQALKILRALAELQLDQDKVQDLLK